VSRVGLRAVAALAVVLAIHVPSVRAADDFVVIAHPSVQGTAVHRADLAGVFLRKVQRWGDRSVAVPVDQSATSAVRRAFSEAVLGMPVSTALQYWQKQMFATPPQRPPAVKASDAEVIAFVASTAGAVGYVSPGASLPPGVKALSLAD
jgi:ABC-type phosphate transport system substrate-binding protein